MAALINFRTQQKIVASVELALTRRQRKKGLLGRPGISEDEAMLISPCVAVHTVGLGFPIDVAFVDKHGVAVRLVHRLQPWRLAGSARAHSVIELAAGRLEACDVKVGDRLYIC
jgi:uncharacterized membrane protein (UPF0127 family)